MLSSTRKSRPTTRSGSEWRELLDVDGSDRSTAFLQSHPTLALDTKHFDTEFVDRLLTSFPDLEWNIDGLLVHGDNWQAVNTMAREQYRGSCSVGLHRSTLQY